MQLGLVGLGKMGGNMRKRLRQAGHEVIGYARTRSVSDVDSLSHLVSSLRAPRVVWVMVPAGQATEQIVQQLSTLLEPGDVVVEGGNSRWSDDQRHAALLAEKKIEYVDVGVSGGVWGLTNGYALMVGGEQSTVQRLQPIFDALKPEHEGFVHAGPVGAGHFTKMVHNGIEYGLMQAYAEGFELLHASGLVDNVPQVISSWTSGTVIRSWLLDLLVLALKDDPH